MYYKISCAGHTHEIRRDTIPTERLVKNCIMDVYKSQFCPPDMHERINFYHEVDKSPVTIEESGPDDKYTAPYKLTHAENSIKRMYRAMEMELSRGNPVVRRTTAGYVVFTCLFPRWRPDGTWWERESQHLAYDDYALALLQLKFAKIFMEAENESIAI